MKQLTLRKIPESVEKKLRCKAAENQQSLNQTALRALAVGLGIDTTTAVKRDLSKLTGRWSASESLEFERNTEIFETIDDEVWNRE